MEAYKRGSHTVWDCKYHLVWVTKYRYPVRGGDVGKRLRLVWTEKGGPAVTAPTRRSFGTRMMDSLGQQLNGQVQLNYQPTGFIYTLDVRSPDREGVTRSLFANDMFDGVKRPVL
jgi:two-component sensor histidine kinase